METHNQELKKLEENLKNFIKEQSDKHSEAHERALQELRSQHRKDMEEVRALLLNLQGFSAVSATSNSAPAVRSERDLNYQKAFQPKLTRLEFPKFGGDSLQEWLCRCDQFFEFVQTPEDSKVKIAALHLEGRALRWHQNYMRSKLAGEGLGWKEYVQAVTVRFGNVLHFDPMAQLKNLKQLGTVQAYLDKFNALMNRLCLPEEYTVSCFLAGLREEIQYAVRMFSPQTLQQAVSLAKLQELSVENAQKRGRIHQRGTLISLPPNPQKTAPPLTLTHSPNSEGIGSSRSQMGRSFKHLTSKELEEKRRKGLCCWCDEKYSVGHKCKMKQLYQLVVSAEEEVEIEEVEEEEETAPAEIDKVKLSGTPLESP